MRRRPIPAGTFSVRSHCSPLGRRTPPGLRGPVSDAALLRLPRSDRLRTAAARSWTHGAGLALDAVQSGTPASCSRFSSGSRLRKEGLRWCGSRPPWRRASSRSRHFCCWRGVTARSGCGFARRLLCGLAGTGLLLRCRRAGQLGASARRRSRVPRRPAGSRGRGPRRFRWRRAYSTRAAVAIRQEMLIVARCRSSSRRQSGPPAAGDVARNAAHPGSLGRPAPSRPSSSSGASRPGATRSRPSTAA